MVLSLSIMVAMLGCDKKTGGEDKTDASPTPDSSVENEDDKEEGKEEGKEDEVGLDQEDVEVYVPLENPVVKEDYDYNDYIKLGKYKGIEVKVTQLEVTQDDIEAAIQVELLESGAPGNQVTDRPAKHGDTLNIDFVGYHNGEAFEGGSSEGFELVLGSKRFIEGFEDQLIGAEIDTEVEVNVVFPENYNKDTLAGEPALFKVKINGIQNFELTDDIIKNVMGFDSEEDYRESLNKELENTNILIMKNKKQNDVYNALIDGSDIELPSNLLEYYKSDIITLYTNMAAAYQTDLETLVNMMGYYSWDSFYEDVKAYAKNMVTRELIVKAICSAEGIELTEEEFQTMASEYALEYGYESKEDFLQEADIEVLKEDLLYDKVIRFIIDEAIEI